MGCPKFLAGSYLPTLAGAWGVDLRGEPHGIRQIGGSLDHGEPDSKQPPSLLLSVPLSLFSGLLRPWWGAFTHGLRVRPEAAGQTPQD